MAFWLVLLFFGLGVFLVVKGGDFFVDAASAIAKASGVPTFVIGATIVSVATTLPELMVSAIAASEGKVDMTVGNAVGSVTANTGLILAVALLFMPVKCRRDDYFRQILLLIGSAILLYIACQSGRLTAWGAVLLAVLFAVFLYVNLTTARSAASAHARTKGKVGVRNILTFILGAACIVGGSRILVNSGSELAAYLGVPERVIALTMVAIGTSLPELVTTITAIIKKEAALSVGNLIGANLLDLAMVLPVCTWITGGSLPISGQMVLWDIPVCILFLAIAFIPMLIWQKGFKLQGLAMLALYCGYVALLV